MKIIQERYAIAPAKACSDDLTPLMEKIKKDITSASPGDCIVIEKKDKGKEDSTYKLLSFISQLGRGLNKWLKPIRQPGGGWKIYVSEKVEVKKPQLKKPLSKK